MRRRVAIVTGVLVLALAVPAIAGEITAAPTGDRFSASTFTIDQGETTTFRNTDLTVSHDVVANQTEGGQALFRSDIVPAGSSGPVKGTEFLVTGSYPFRCTLHPGMEATLVVSSAGTPKPKPGSAGDTTAPQGKVAITDRKLAAVRKRRALKVSGTSNEPASFAYVAKSGRTVIARGSAAQAGGATLKLTRAGRKLVANRRTLKVSLGATLTDGAGNKSSASTTKTLR